MSARPPPAESCPSHYPTHASPPPPPHPRVRDAGGGAFLQAGGDRPGRGAGVSTQSPALIPSAKRAETADAHAPAPRRVLLCQDVLPARRDMQGVIIVVIVCARRHQPQKRTGSDTSEQAPAQATSSAVPLNNS